MNNRQKSVRAQIFEKTIRSNINFRDVENLLIADGCKKLEGKGSRTKFTFGDTTLAIHRPHPKPHLKRYQVKDVRDFLEQIGKTPCDLTKDTQEPSSSTKTTRSSTDGL